MSDSLQLNGLQRARPLCPSPFPRACPSSCSLHQWCHPTILSSAILFAFCSSIFPSIRVFSIDSALCIGGQNIGASTSVTALGLTVWSPCSLKDSQESSLAPQFESINSLAFCLLYGLALTTVHDHWEDHSLDYTDLCRQRNVSAVLTIWWCLCVKSSRVLLKKDIFYD